MFSPSVGEAVNRCQWGRMKGGVKGKENPWIGRDELTASKAKCCSSVGTQAFFTHSGKGKNGCNSELSRKHSYYNFILTVPPFRDFKQLHEFHLLSIYWLCVIVAYAPGILHTLFWVLTTASPLDWVSLTSFYRWGTVAQRHQSQLVSTRQMGLKPTAAVSKSPNPLS